MAEFFEYPSAGVTISVSWTPTSEAPLVGVGQSPYVPTFYDLPAIIVSASVRMKCKTHFFLVIAFKDFDELIQTNFT